MTQKLHNLIRDINYSFDTCKWDDELEITRLWVCMKIEQSRDPAWFTDHADMEIAMNILNNPKFGQGMFLKKAAIYYHDLIVDYIKELEMEDIRDERIAAAEAEYDRKREQELLDKAS